MSHKQKDEMVIWAENAVNGIDESAMFLQIYNPRVMIREDPEYLLHLGYAMMADKPIGIIAAYGEQIPEKLQTVADVVEFYDRDDMQSIGEAGQRAVEQLQQQLENQ